MRVILWAVLESLGIWKHSDLDKLEDCASGGGGDEKRRGWHEICEGWRGRVDPGGEEKEMSARSEHGEASGNSNVRLNLIKERFGAV